MADGERNSELSQSVGFSSGSRGGGGETVFRIAGNAVTGGLAGSGGGDPRRDQDPGGGGRQFAAAGEDAARAYRAGRTGGEEVEPDRPSRADSEEEGGGAKARGRRAESTAGASGEGVGGDREESVEAEETGRSTSERDRAGSASDERWTGWLWSELQRADHRRDHLRAFGERGHHEARP